MKKTIFNVAVPMQDQEQCDRMKAVCLENGLPIWEDNVGFNYKRLCVFAYNKNPVVKEFYCLKAQIIIEEFTEGYTQVTEAEFLELLKEYKDGTQVHD
jgi:hypothetical protein